MRSIGDTLGNQARKLKAVASGALPNGDPVVVNSDGTVSVVAGTDVSTDIGASTVFEAGATEFVSATFDSNANKVVIAYKDDGNSNYGKAVVGTVDPSDNSISFGTEVTFHTDQTRDIELAFDSNANKVVIVYRDDNNDGDPAAIVGTVSGTSISFGTPVFISNDQCKSESLGCAFDSVNNKVVVIWADAYNSNYGTARVGTVSGTSISFGTEVVFHSATTGHCYIAYDENAEKVVVVYQDNSDSNYGKAVVGTVSGTSISFGSEATFNAGASSDIECAYDASAQRIVIAYTASTLGTAVVGEVSGTSITFGTAVQFQGTSTGYIAIAYDGNAGKTFIVYKGPSNYLTAITGTVTGTAISFDTSFQVNTDSSEYIGAAYDSNAERIVVGFKDRGNSNKGTGVAIENAYESTNLTAENYIGVASSGYADTQGATIDIQGSINSNQSGLTAGQAYYVQTDGTLDTTPADPSVFAGTALTATKLLVKG